MRPPRPRQSRTPPPRAHHSSRPRAGERWLYGRHTVAAALANPERRWRRLVALAGQEAEAQQLLAGAVAERRATSAAALQILEREALGALLPPGSVHQGFALEVEPLPAIAFGDLLRELETTPARSIILLLDQITDPQNIGAVLRSAAAFGARAVLTAAHGAPPITGALAKAASGAVDRLPLIRIANLVQALARLKENGFWVCGLDETAEQSLSDVELGARVALVLGSEGSGLRRLVREHCD